MKTIAQHVRDGAISYLKQQYKVVVVVFIILALLFAAMAYFDFKQLGALCIPDRQFSRPAGTQYETATYASAGQPMPFDVLLIAGYRSPSGRVP